MERNPTREELRKKLRSKIKNKSDVRRGGVSRKDAVSLSDKITKLVEVLKDKNITVNTELTEDVIQTVTDIISINDIKKVLSQIQNNEEVSDNFKLFMNKILNANTPSQ